MNCRRASDVKAHWREIVDEVNAVGELVVTDDDRPAVVVVSMDRYAELNRNARAEDSLDALRSALDRELAVLDRPGAPAELRKVFASAPAELADAANGAGRRGKR